MKISAVIITQNEEANIAEAIHSVDLADEVLVVDSGSSDRTREIAAELGAKVIFQPWLGFGKQKQFAVDNAQYDRILSIDADERLSPELRDEIIAIRDGDNAADGYRIPRLTTYMGRPIRHGGWYPDRQLRFFDRRKGRWKDVAVHESVEMDEGSSVAYLRGNILHKSVDTSAEHLEMIRSRYAPLAARSQIERGAAGSRLKLYLSPLGTFLGGYVFKAGFLDGTRGLRIASYAAYNTYLKHKLILKSDVPKGRA